MARKRSNNILVDVMLVLLKTLWAIVKLPYYFWTKDDKGNSVNRSTLDLSLVNSQWQEIEQLMSTSGSTNFRHAVTEADKLFDYVLKRKVASGESFADRLKAAEKLMDRDSYDMVWRAHKVRNKLVHEMETEVMSWEARDAISGFKKGLKVLNAL
jgi:hypothetical protein